MELRVRCNCLCLLLITLSSFRVSLSVTIIDDEDVSFICYSSNECHGNQVSGIAEVENCCISGGGLSYQTVQGQCGNCFDQQSFTSEGSQFYLGIFDNHHPQGPFQINRLRIAVDPVDSNLTSFTIEIPGETTTYTGPQEIYFKAEDIQLNSPKSRERGVRVRSLNGAALSVVAYSEEFVSSDSFKVLPCVRQPSNAYEYYAVSVIQSDIEFRLGLTSFSLPPEGKSAIVIVSTEENTILNITLTQDVFIGDANDLVEQVGSDVILAGQTVTITLAKSMQTLYLASNDDMTGSRVVSNRPISFTSGHECGTLPNTMLYCDQMVDQIPPTATWGKTFIVASLANRTSNDSIKIVASRNDTTIRVLCTVGQQGILYIGDAGGFSETLLISGSSCYFESDKPVLLVQFSRSSLLDDVINSDPFMVIIPPVEQYRSSYIIRTFATSDPSSPAGQHFINVLLPSAYNPNLVLLDGLPLEADYQTVFCDDFESVCAYTFSLPISETVHSLSHTDPSARLNAIVYWFSFRVGQGYFAGMMQQPIALPSVTVAALNNFANESEGEALFLLTRSGEVDISATVLFETTTTPPGPSPATAGEDFEQFSMEVVFSPGETELMVAVPLKDDVFPEQEFEHFEVVLSASPGVLIGSPSFVNFTITDDDPQLPVVNVSVESSSLSTTELAGSIEVRLLKTSNAVGPVSVLVRTMDGTASIEDWDYIPLSELVTFERDETEKTVTVTIRADRKIEDSEDFTVVVTPVNDADHPFLVRVNANEGTSTVTIQDEEIAVVGFADSSYTTFEGDEPTNVVIDVILGGRDLQKTIIVVLSSQDGTAVTAEPGDYDPINTVLTFTPETTRIFVTLNIQDDSLIESTESFYLRLFPFEEESSVVFSPAMTVISIVDNDRGIISLEPLRPLVREGDGSARVTVSLRGASIQTEKGAGGAVVSITASSVTAVMGEDFEAPLTSTVVLTQEDSVEEILIPVIDDELFEGATDETFNVGISLPSCSAPGMLTIENAQSIVSIEDNDVRPVARVRFSSATYSGVEGTQLNLIVEGDGQNQEPVLVEYSVLRTGTAGISIDVAVETAGSLSLPAGGPASATIPVSLIEDSIAEPSEFFLVRISVGDVNGEIVSGLDVANVTIIDNDRVIFGFEATEYTVMEDVGVLEVNILKLTETTAQSSVIFSTRDVIVAPGSVTHIVSDSDGELVFEPSEMRKTLSITIVDDQLIFEVVEIFNMLLTVMTGQAVDTAVQDGLAQVLIYDNDQGIQFSIQPTFTTVPESSGQVSVTIVRDDESTENSPPVNFTVTTMSGTAISGIDFLPLDETVLFLPGDTEKTVTVDIVQDNVVEEDELFTIIATYSYSTVLLGFERVELRTQVIIQSVEEPPRIGFDPQVYTVEEGSEAVTLRIVTSDPSRFVDSSGALFYTVDGSATASGEVQLDFTGTSRANAIPLTFSPGDMDITLTIPINDDQVAEGREQFFGQIISGGGISDLVLTNPTAVIDIIDNDEYRIGWEQTLYQVDEEIGSLELCLIVMSETTLQDSASFRVSTIAGSAAGSMDYSDLNETVTFTAGVRPSTRVCVDVSIIDDENPELTECFFLTAAAPESDERNIRVSPELATATVCIMENDAQPPGTAMIGFSQSMYNLTEGSDATNTVCITVVALAGQVDEEATVSFFSTSNPSNELFAETASINFTAVSVGDLILCGSRVILDDNIAGQDQMLLLNVTVEGSTSITVAPDRDTAIVFIIDNDDLQVGWEQTSYTMFEGGEVGEICMFARNEVSLESSATITVMDVETDAQAGVDYVEIRDELVFRPGIIGACINISIIDDSLREQVECFNVVGETNDERISVRTPTTTVCIIDDDFITRVEAQCSFSPTDASNIIQVACTTSEVAPDTPIAFSTCEVDEVQSEICSYPSFTINTNNFQPGQHTLVLVLQVGDVLVSLIPDYVFNGTALPIITPTPPPTSTNPFQEPFLVDCSISTQLLTTADVQCAATVGQSRVNIDSCFLDSNPSEICDFPSFSFSLSNLEPGDHTLTITFSDANFPDTTVVETLTFTSTVAVP